MIRINLAKAGQASYVTAKPDASGKTKGTGVKLKRGGGKFDIADLKPFRKLIMGGVIIYLAMTSVEGWQEEELAAVRKQVEAVQEQGKKIQTELAKLKKYELVKKQMDADFAVITAKINLITKLVEDRHTPPRMMYSLTTAIPANAWIKEFKMTPKEVMLNGTALEYGQISDFMRALGEVVYFNGVQLKNTQQLPEKDNDPALTSFEIVLNRRPAAEGLGQ